MFLFRPIIEVVLVMVVSYKILKRDARMYQVPCHRSLSSTYAPIEYNAKHIEQMPDVFAWTGADTVHLLTLSRPGTVDIVEKVLPLLLSSFATGHANCRRDPEAPWSCMD